MPEKIVRFDEFVLDFGRFQLQCGDATVKLEGRPMQVLMLLVEREEIADYLWGNNVFVDVDQSINTAVRKVRIALNDCVGRPQYLQTVVGRGYRFLAQPAVESPEGLGGVKMFTAEELGQAVLSAAGLAPEQQLPPLLKTREET